MDEETRADRMKIVLEAFEEMRKISDNIRHNNSRRDNHPGHYPIGKGYSTQVRRPVRDILKYMDRIELIMSNLLFEIYSEEASS